MPITETTTTEIAQVLESRKSTLKPTVLFLGARTGGLFDNLMFYDYIKRFSNFFSIFDSLTIIDKFKKCHESIAQLSEREIYDLLEVSLRSNQVRI